MNGAQGKGERFYGPLVGSRGFSMRGNAPAMDDELSSLSSSTEEEEEGEGEEGAFVGDFETSVARSWG